MFVLIFSLSAVCTLLARTEHAVSPEASWVQHLDRCYLDSKGHLGREGLAALSSHELVAYCVTRNTESGPSLTRRDKPQESDPFRVNVFFLNPTDGHIIETRNLADPDEDTSRYISRER